MTSILILLRLYGWIHYYEVMLSNVVFLARLVSLYSCGGTLQTVVKFERKQKKRGLELITMFLYRSFDSTDLNPIKSLQTLNIKSDVNPIESLQQRKTLNPKP